MATSDRGDHGENPVMWKRENQYAPEIVTGGLSLVPAFRFNLDNKFVAELDTALATEGTISNELRQVFLDDGSPIVGSGAVKEFSFTGPYRDYAQRFCDGGHCTAQWQVEDEVKNDYGVFQHPDGSLSVLDLTYVLPLEVETYDKVHGIHASWSSSNRYQNTISEDGYVAGNWHAKVVDAYFYDMNEDVFVNLSGGIGMSVNNHKIVLSKFLDNSENPPAFLGSPDAVSEENPFRRVHTFDPMTLRLSGINDDNIVVGEFEGNPIRVRPTGVDANGYPIYDAFNRQTDILTELGPAFSASDAIDISSGPTPYIVGISFDFAAFGNVGVVWDIDGNAIQRLGSNRLPIGITEDGTIAYGSIRSIAGTESAALWYTTDDWENFTEVVFDDFISDLQNAGVPGAELADTFTGPLTGSFNTMGCCSVSGVNNAGQIVVQGIPAEAGALTGGAPGAPFLFDMPPLGGAVLKGDVNNDSIVDFLDITPFVNAQSAEGDEDAFLLLTPDGCFLCADIDIDGAVDFLDITPFVNLLDSVAAAVPEPASAVLLILGLVSMLRRRHY